MNNASFSKKYFFVFASLFWCFSALQAEKLSYYGKGSLTPLVENFIEKTCNYIALAGGITIQDCLDSTSESVQYVLPNHLHSSQVFISEASGKPISNCVYDPYGTITDGNNRTDCKYSGTYSWKADTQTFLSPTRHYEATSQRFLSQDPMRQGFSPYVAVAGDPINHVDKDGKSPDFEAGLLIEALDLFASEPQLTRVNNMFSEGTDFASQRRWWGSYSRARDTLKVERVRQGYLTQHVPHHRLVDQAFTFAPINRGDAFFLDSGADEPHIFDRDSLFRWFQRSESNPVNRQTPHNSEVGALLIDIYAVAEVDELPESDFEDPDMD